MKSDYFYPHLGDRRSPREWQEDGSKPVAERAREKARALLASHYPDHISDEADRALRESFDIRLSREQIGRSS